MKLSTVGLIGLNTISGLANIYVYITIKNRLRWISLIIGSVNIVLVLLLLTGILK